MSMGFTNFAALAPKQKAVWARDVNVAARDKMFLTKFMGNENSVVQRITEMTKTERGESVIMQLIADLVEDGVSGDDEMEGNEEALQAFYQEINIDLIANAVREKGKMAAQKSVVNFRLSAKDRLAYWLASRSDQLGFLTMSGISYALQNNGAPRPSTRFANLKFAADVTPPSAKRSLMWDGTQLLLSNTSAITTAFVPSYKMIVDAVAYAKEHYVKPLLDGGKEYYVMFVHPQTLAAIKKDPDYQRAVVGVATKMGVDSPWFNGGTVMIDGVVIHEHRLVYNTKGATSGNKWGSLGAINGTRTLLCGSQALGFADVAPPEWDEKTFQYGRQSGIYIDKMMGLLKPKFYSNYDRSVEDFGVVTIDHYIQ